MDFGIGNKVAWITGASGAIGAAIAELLAEEQATVVVSGRSQDKLQELARQISSATGAKVSPLVVDATDRANVDAAMAKLIGDHGRIDILVNSMSLSIFGDFLTLTDEDWDAVMQAKYMGYVRTMRAALPHMVRQGEGRIVNISGRGGRQPTPAHLPGCSVNAAVNLLTKGLADVYRPHNIRINAVAPGPIASDRQRQIKAANEAVSGGVLPRALLEHIGSPRDIAEAVAFLVSDRSRHMTGTVMQVDGGGTATVN